MVSIDEDTCTGCDLCADSCPAELLTFDEEKQKTYVTGDEAECMGCEACIAVCESGAISIIEI
jgi:ferredoxin